MSKMTAVILQPLRLVYRRWLRLRRLFASAACFHPVAFIKFVLLDMLINPACRGFKQKPVMHVRVKGYDGDFLVRMGTSDLECLLEVILEEEYATAIRLAKTARFIIDAGANVGYASRYFLRAFPGASIICVEPDKENMSLLRRNIALAAGGSQVTFVDCFLAAHAGMMGIDPSQPKWALRMVPVSAATGDAIPVKTVDQLLEETGTNSKRVDLFKCDIEGAEAQLFGEPGAWLNRVSCLAVETHNPYWDTSFMADLRRFSNEFEYVQENEMVYARRSGKPGEDPNE